MSRQWGFLVLLLLTGCAKHYRVEGLVIQVDPVQRTILVSHRPIDGFMGAMAMPFHVAPKEDLTKLAPGTRVNFELQVGRHASLARKIQPRVARLEADGQEIRVPPTSNKIALGTPVPDFTLTDQTGKAIRFADLRGHVVAIDFIYTRCPLPDVCPRLSANFAYLSKRLHDRGLILLSITIDPQYDTPAVLSDYGRRYGADAGTWHFLTGTMDQIRNVAGLFGLIYWAEEASLTHTSATAVIGRDGKLQALIEGAGYRPDQLRDLVEHALQTP